MPKLPAARDGEPLQVKGKEIRYSSWPVVRTTRRYGLQSHIYSANPWGLISHSIARRCPGPARDEARACLRQAEFFFRSATTAAEWAAKPLPLYYSFLNLAKAFSLTTGVRQTYRRAQHGITDRLDLGHDEPRDSYLLTSRRDSGLPSVFSDFIEALTGQAMGPNVRLPLAYLLPQILPGHRLWCSIYDAQERFVPIAGLPILRATSSHALWTELHVAERDLKRLGLSGKQLMASCRASNEWRQVDGQIPTPSDGVINRFEQITPTTYGGRPSDELALLVRRVRPFIWATALATPPYRNYYLYSSPATEHRTVLPQLGSIYAIAFYLGSITRYRPQSFDPQLNGDLGGFIQEVLASQPAQFLYLIASEFARRDVVRAPLV